MPEEERISSSIHSPLAITTEGEGDRKSHSENSNRSDRSGKKSATKFYKIKKNSKVQPTDVQYVQINTSSPGNSFNGDGSEYRNITPDRKSIDSIQESLETINDNDVMPTTEGSGVLGRSVVHSSSNANEIIDSVNHVHDRLHSDMVNLSMRVKMIEEGLREIRNILITKQNTDSGSRNDSAPHGSYNSNNNNTDTVQIERENSLVLINHAASEDSELPNYQEIQSNIGKQLSLPNSNSSDT